MAKHRNARKGARDIDAILTKRPRSHKILEGLLLVSALGILFVLFSFFALELRKISEHAFGYGEIEGTRNTSSLVNPPRVEARVIGSDLLIVAVDDAGHPTKTLYSSDLSDEIADFTLFAVPQTGYQGYIYVRPIIDGTLPNLTVYPLDADTGSLKAATLNVPADAFILSGDETLVGTLSDNALTLYTLEDGGILASGIVPDDWLSYVADETATLSLSENSCLSLTLALPPAELTPFPAVCP